MKNLKICLVGKMRSGKSQAVEHIKSQFYPQAEVVDFGDALKEVVNILYPLNNNEDGSKRRKKLQTIGQHMRKLNEDIWIECVDMKINKMPDTTILCASCRQQNEYNYLKKKGFIFIKIESDINDRVQRMLDCGDNFEESDLNHETELLIDSFEVDYIIKNNDTIESFKDKLNKIILDINGGF